MVRKSVFSVMLVVMMVLAAGMVYAYDIDGLKSDNDFGLYNVSVNPGNLGDALVAGYFNTRDAGNFFTIVNTTDGFGVVARIRFREATESEEVLDFNICLSENDVFAASLVDDGSQTRIYQLDSDTTLTRPTIPDGGIPFKHEDNGGLQTVTADETREGYYEVIGLIVIPQAIMDLPDFNCPEETLTAGPDNDVPNVLTGSHFLQPNNTPYLFGYRMMALADFHFIGISSVIGNEQITLIDGFDGLEGVDWALTKADFSSEYMLENSGDPILGNATGESTYVITFPTKKNNIEAQTARWADPVSCPDSDSSYTSGELDGVVIDIAEYDENEHFEEIEEFSPSQNPKIELCYEVNVLELGGSDILDSNVEKSLTAPFGFGWLKVDLHNGINNHHAMNATNTIWSYGLPAWVTWLQTVNGTLSHEMEVAYKTNLQPVTPPAN
jgi:hypothetical protein